MCVLWDERKKFYLKKAKKKGEKYVKEYCIKLNSLSLSCLLLAVSLVEVICVCI